MAQPSISENGHLFARRLDELRAEAPAPDSGARPAAVSAKGEEDFRDREARQAAGEGRATPSPRR